MDKIRPINDPLDVEKHFPGIHTPLLNQRGCEVFKNLKVGDVFYHFPPDKKRIADYFGDNYKACDILHSIENSLKCDYKVIVMKKYVIIHPFFHCSLEKWVLKCNPYVSFKLVDQYGITSVYLCDIQMLNNAFPQGDVMNDEWEYEVFFRSMDDMFKQRMDYISMMASKLRKAKRYSAACRVDSILMKFTKLYAKFKDRHEQQGDTDKTHHASVEDAGCK